MQPKIGDRVIIKGIVDKVMPDDETLFVLMIRTKGADDPLICQSSRISKILPPKGEHQPSKFKIGDIVKLSYDVAETPFRVISKFKWTDKNYYVIENEFKDYFMTSSETYLLLVNPQ